MPRIVSSVVKKPTSSQPSMQEKTWEPAGLALCKSGVRRFLLECNNFHCFLTVDFMILGKE